MVAKKDAIPYLPPHRHPRALTRASSTSARPTDTTPRPRSPLPGRPRPPRPSLARSLALALSASFVVTEFSPATYSSPLFSVLPLPLSPLFLVFSLPTGRSRAVSWWSSRAHALRKSLYSSGWHAGRLRRAMRCVARQQMSSGGLKA